MLTLLTSGLQGLMNELLSYKTNLIVCKLPLQVKNLQFVGRWGLTLIKSLKNQTYLFMT